MARCEAAVRAAMKAQPMDGSRGAKWAGWMARC